jgi:serine/threonine protein kinase
LKKDCLIVGYSGKRVAHESFCTGFVMRGVVMLLRHLHFTCSQATRVMQAVHDERVVHADLKPANFVLVSGQVKLIDFGIAKACSRDTTAIFRENVTGTVRYMSPEALKSAQRRHHVLPPQHRLCLGGVL